MKKKISIVLKGGLGNQLFQIAFLFTLSQKANYQIVLNNKIDGVRQKTYFDTILQSFANVIHNNSKNKCTKINEIHEFHFTDYETINKCIVNSFIRFHGYFQNIKYFISNLDSFKEFIKLKDLIHNNHIEYQQNTIALHLRFGDVDFKKYVKPSVKYYISSINTLLSKENGIHSVIVFHENLEKDSEIISEYVNTIKSHFPNLTFRDIYTDFHIFEDWKQLLMISQCQNIIIANSTFSLWGAYLSDDSNVCYPNEFFTDKRDVSGLFLKQWHCINI
jgi:hypothetical protein